MFRGHLKSKINKKCKKCTLNRLKWDIFILENWTIRKSLPCSTSARKVYVRWLKFFATLSMSTNETENTKGTDFGIKFYWLGEFEDMEFLNNEDKQSVHPPTHTYIFAAMFTHYASKFGKLSSGHRTGKGQFSFQVLRKAMPKNAKTIAHCTSLTG